MDNTIVVSSYGAIGTEMKELNRTSWIATSYVFPLPNSLRAVVLMGSRYLLTQTSFQPLYGKLSDIFGRKPALLFSYFIFGTGCLGCGLARSMNELIAARVGLWRARGSIMFLSNMCGVVGFCWDWWGRDDDGRFDFAE